MISYYAPNAIIFPLLHVNVDKVYEIARLERLDESLLARTEKESDKMTIQGEGKEGEIRPGTDGFCFV